MATTTNYGWTTPDDTSLVKDGAAAIRTLGSSIDTSLNTALGTKKAGLVLLNTTSFSGVTSQSISSVFSATYDNYRIMLRLLGSTDTAIKFRLRSGTTDASGSDYTVQELQASSTSISGSRSTGTSAVIGVSNSVYHAVICLDLFNPFAATPTSFAQLSNRSQSTAQVFSTTGIHTLSTSYDGITVLADSTYTLTGSASVYGYNK
jgi:hypothetical protein